VVAGGNEGQGNGQSLVNVLLANLISKDLNQNKPKSPSHVNDESL